MIAIDDSNYTVTVYDSDRQEIGALNCKEIDDERHSYLKLVWAFLDKSGNGFTRRGIGRQCLLIVKERYGLPIVAEENNGIKKDDGSHLTGDAPAFIARMREEGLIEPLRSEWYADE
jgi:hypothetical protein